MTYLRNTWYVAAWNDEVNPGTFVSPPARRTLCTGIEASSVAQRAPAVRARRVLDGLIKAEGEASAMGSPVKPT